MSVAVIVVIFLLLSAGIGFFTPTAWPHARWSPLELMLLLILVLFIFGHLHG